jgi:hypothetical protein
VGFWDRVRTRTKMRLEIPQIILGVKRMVLSGGNIDYSFDDDSALKD